MEHNICNELTVLCGVAWNKPGVVDLATASKRKQRKRGRRVQFLSLKCGFLSNRPLMMMMMRLCVCTPLRIRGGKERERDRHARQQTHSAVHQSNASMHNLAHQRNKDGHPAIPTCNQQTGACAGLNRLGACDEGMTRGGVEPSSAQHTLVPMIMGTELQEVSEKEDVCTRQLEQARPDEA